MKRLFAGLLLLLCSVVQTSLAGTDPGQKLSRTKPLHLPLTFERNDGQAGAAYRFVARHQGVPAFFGPQGVDFQVGGAADTSRLVRMLFDERGSSEVRLEGAEPLPGKANYLRGTDPKLWRTAVPTFGEIAYREVFPGVDLLFHGDAIGRELEHDFVVRPGANPRAIRFSFAGADRAHLNGRGELVLSVGQRELVLHAPTAWQDTASGRRIVRASLSALGDGMYGFRVGRFDRMAPLIIDPVLVFATYLDGTAPDSIRAITTDSAGNVYITGQTGSADFPVMHAEQTSIKTGRDAFVAKLDPSGKTLLYSTYLGGSSDDGAEAIAVDAAGNAVVSGASSSSDFPAAGKLLTGVDTATVTYNFVSSLTADGGTLRFSGFLGSTEASAGGPRLNRVAVDASGAAYVAGSVQSGYPYTPGAYGSSPAPYPANETLFVAKILADGTVAYGATVPEAAQMQPTMGSTPRIEVGGLTVDSKGEAIVAGVAGKDLPVTSGTVAPTFPASSPGSLGYVLKLNAAGSALVFSTYLPGTSTAEDVALDASEDMYVVGTTSQQSFATTPGAFQPALSATPNCNCSAGYVLRLRSDGTQVLAATFFGDAAPPLGSLSFAATGLSAVRVDAAGNVVAGGWTSLPVPLANPLSGNLITNGQNSAYDALILVRFSPDLSTEQFGTYLNSPSQDEISTGYASMFLGLATDPQNHVLVAGSTLSTLFPTTAGALQSAPPLPASSYETLQHQFVASVDVSVPTPAACYGTLEASFGTVPVGTTGQTSIPVTNCGNGPLTLPDLHSTDPAVAVAHTCNGIGPGAACQIQLTFTPTSSNEVDGTINVPMVNGLWPQTLLFDGSGGVPFAYLPGNLSFPDLLVGQSGGTAVLDIFNTGTAPLNLAGVAVTGDFQVINNPCGSAIAAQAACGIVIGFAPTGAGTRTGTLTLTDNLTSSTQQTILLTGTGLTTAPVPSITQIPAVAQIASGTGSLVVRGNGFLPSSTLSWNGQPLTTYYEGEQQLVATLPQTDLAQVGEATVTVTTPAPGGGVSAPATATIFGRMPIQVLHEVYSPATNLIYATVSQYSPVNANSVVAIDPVSMQVTSTLLSGNIPNQIAMSGDGSLLYVGLDGSNSVVQMALPSGTQNFTVALPPSQAFLSPVQTVASALAVVPGSPHTWVAGLCAVSYTPCGLGVTVYDDAVARPTTGTGSQLTATSFTFVDDPTVLYSTEYGQSPPDISSYLLSPAGITRTATSSFDARVGGAALTSDGQAIFVANGQVVDPTTLTAKFRYAAGGQAFALDLPNSRLFYALDPYGSGTEALTLTAVDKSSQVTIGQVSLPGTGVAEEVLRFGAKGLVINQQSGLLFIQSSLVTATPRPVQLTLSAANLTFAAQRQGTVSEAQTLTVTNSGSSTVTILSVNASGDFGETNTCAGPLAAGSSCTVGVTFAPTAEGTRSGQIAIANDGDPGVLVVGLTGTGLAPLTYVGTLSPSSVDFGAQLLNTTSAAQTLTLMNTGTGVLTVGTSTISAGDFAATNNCPATLAAGASCVFNVTFTPTLKGSRYATLTIPSNASTGGLTAYLGGTGQSAVTYSGLFSPNLVYFSAQPIGTTSAPKTLTFTNTGNAVLTISGVTVGSGNFRQTNTCGPTLAVGASCQFSVVFTPQGYYAPDALVGAALTVNDNADSGASGAYLEGTAAAALTYTASLTPVSANFGSQTVGVASAAQTFTLANTGMGSLTLAGITATGDFAQSNRCPSVLAAGQSCAIAVTFTPTAVGSRTGSLSANPGAPATVQVAALAGTGAALPAPAATLSPGSLTFGAQDVGSTSGAQSVTLSNPGTAPLAISGIATTGDFVQTNNCGSSLAAGGSCTIGVAFAPTASGTRSGTLTVSDNAASGGQTATLTGNAEAPVVLAPAATGSTTAAVSAGATASYSLSMTSNGYTGSVALSCSGAPQNASCTVSPATLALSGGQVAPFTVTVNTGSTVQGMVRPSDRSGIAWAAMSLGALLAIPLMPGRSRLRRRVLPSGVGVLVLLVAGLSVSGCGGGTFPTVPTPPAHVAPGTYILTVSATANTYTATQQLTLKVE